MSFFNFKKNKQQEAEKMTTLEQIKKAYEDLSEDDKKSFHQSLSDRIHESIAAQERADGKEDSQSAEAREHEALGEEHEQGKGVVSELHDSDDTAEEKREDKLDEDKSDTKYSEILSRLEALESHFKSEDDSDAEAAEKAKEVYGLGNGYFPQAKKEDEKITPKEAAAITRNLKI